VNGLPTACATRSGPGRSSRWPSRSSAWGSTPPSRTTTEQARPRRWGWACALRELESMRRAAAGIHEVRDDVAALREDVARLVARLDTRRETAR
jgi:ubiquinone biosynthesis protein UbiJ